MKSVAVVTLALLPATFVSVRTDFPGSTSMNTVANPTADSVQYELLQLLARQRVRAGSVDNVQRDMDLLVHRCSLDGCDHRNLVLLAASTA